MGKFYGFIGFVEIVESSPGVYEELVTEKQYYGDMTRTSRNIRETEHANSDVSASNTLSIVADSYAYENIFAMRYVNWMGVNWKINNVEINRPRLVMYIGGVYNGDTPRTPVKARGTIGLS